MRARTMVALVVALVLPLAACASSTDSGSGGDAPQSLAGTAWDLAQYAPAGASELAPVPEGVTPTAEFTADSTVTAVPLRAGLTPAMRIDGLSELLGLLALIGLVLGGRRGSRPADRVER